MVRIDLSSAEKEYTAVIAHLTGTQTVADCFYKESDNGYHVITKLDKGSLAIDTSFDPTLCAKAITDFTDNDILVSLQNNASQGVVWVEGIEHPTFSWDLTNRLADYTAVNVALDKVPQDISVYTDETVSVLKQAIDSVDTSLSAAEQSKVDAMAQAIEDAIAALQYKDADYTKVDAAIGLPACRKEQKSSQQPWAGFNSTGGRCHWTGRDGSPHLGRCNGRRAGNNYPCLQRLVRTNRTCLRKIVAVPVGVVFQQVG